jgi:hypothetical protein
MGVRGEAVCRAELSAVLSAGNVLDRPNGDGLELGEGIAERDDPAPVRLRRADWPFWDSFGVTVLDERFGLRVGVSLVVTKSSSDRSLGGAVRMRSSVVRGASFDSCACVEEVEDVSERTMDERDEAAARAASSLSFRIETSSLASTRGVKP